MASRPRQDRAPMSRNPMVVRTVPALRRALDGLRSRKATVALVPTMGALHDGHVSLVRLAKRRAAKVVVSIFVNPTQFAPTEDFGSYPRTWKADIAKLAAENVELIWHPDVKTMYPERFATRILPEGPAIAGLEDRFRPHFFGGVATVVGKLFTQVRPDVAIFGEKDFQQLRVVTQIGRHGVLGKIAPALERAHRPRRPHDYFWLHHQPAPSDAVLVAERLDRDDLFPCRDFAADHPIERAAGEDFRVALRRHAGDVDM